MVLPRHTIILQSCHYCAPVSSLQVGVLLSKRLNEQSLKQRHTILSPELSDAKHLGEIRMQSLQQ